MKSCPHCKNTLTENNDICPHCGRVLIERINTNFSQTSHTASQNIITSIIKKLKGHLKKVISKFKNIKLGVFKTYAPFVVILLLIVFSVSQKGSTSTAPVSVLPNGESPQPTPTDVPTVQIKDPKTYVSLSNGTVLSKDNNNFKGVGELKINNGTEFDAIAKLVNIATNKSVLTLYIKANSNYDIGKISDGNYKLFFNLGNDWDAKVKAFAINSSYEVFQENFDFTTSEYEAGDYQHTRYSIFSVTLNPILGGQAKTNDVNAVEFGSY